MFEVEYDSDQWLCIVQRRLCDTYALFKFGYSYSDLLASAPDEKNHLTNYLVENYVGIHRDTATYGIFDFNSLPLINNVVDDGSKDWIAISKLDNPYPEHDFCKSPHIYRMSFETKSTNFNNDGDAKGAFLQYLKYETYRYINIQELRVLKWSDVEILDVKRARVSTSNH